MIDFIKFIQRVIGYNELRYTYHGKSNIFFFNCRLYNAGLNPNIQKLYPSVSLPAPRGTPMISSMVEWDHSTSWEVADMLSTVIMFSIFF